MPEAQAIDDPDHPGLRRAGPRAAAPYGDDRVEFHLCPARDLLDGVPDDLDLWQAGFDSVDLAPFTALQQACADVLAAGRIDEDRAAVIRSELDGAVLTTAHGQDLRVVHLAEEGFIMRTAGPNGMSLVGPRSVGMNGHGGATSIHIDQDVHGTPLAQLMGGRAPSLFVHDSPDGRCDDASLLLVNLWIPLQQVVQPLVLADGRSLDRRRHQLRYGLPTGSFLERDDEQAINDIWTLLHDEGQRWYLRSEMDHRSAWIFNTLSVPHGAGTLPGEDVAEACFRALDAVSTAAGGPDAHDLTAALDAAADLRVPEGSPPALSAAVEEMLELLARARRDPAVITDGPSGEWSARADRARARVVRTSLELRLVVTPAD